MVSKPFLSFSVLKRMKTKVRSTMDNTWVNYLIVMHICHENIEKMVSKKEDVNFVQWILSTCSLLLGTEVLKLTPNRRDQTEHVKSIPDTFHIKYKKFK